MKIKVINMFVALSMVLSLFGTALPVTAATDTRITVVCDGNPSDWAGITAIINDAGDITPGDIAAVYATADATNVYFRIDCTGQVGPGLPIEIGIDTDRNQATGYNSDSILFPNPGGFLTQPHGLGIDNTILIQAQGGPPNPATATLGQINNNTWPPVPAGTLTVGTNGYAQSPYIIEVAVPRANLPVLPWRLFVWGMPPAPPPVAWDEAPNNANTTFPRPIVFVSDRDGNLEIYRMNLDGTGQTRLTNGAPADNFPMLSPPGTGNKIAFTSERDGNREIYVMDVNGAGVTRLTNDAAWDLWPSWSPDASQIVFTTNRDGNPEIYTMNATNGSGLIRLTNNTAPDTQPIWSPDGSKIAFTSSRDGNTEIYVMNADGSVQTRLTNNAVLDGAPCWSPDGTKLAFVSERDGNREVYSLDVASPATQTNLTNNTAEDFQPEFLPNGKILFTSGRDGDPELFIMDANGANVAQITDNTAGDWSRGKWLSPTVATLAAENVTATGARLKGDLTNMGSAPNVMVSFEWGTTDAYGNTTSPEQEMTAPGVFTFDLGSLATGTPIHYRAKARGDNVIAYGNDMTFTPTSTGTPDLIVFEKHEVWEQGSTTQYKVYYTIKNIGTAAASAGYKVGVTVDTVLQGEQPTINESLAPDATYSNNFTIPITISGTEDNIRVIADFENFVIESNEVNNHLDNTWGAPPRPIVFVSERDGNLEIYKMNPDGTGQTNITNNPAWDNMAMLSPDGTKVAFVSERQGNRDVYVMNIDGSGVTRLTSDAAFDVGPTWSPDGTQIVFATGRDGNLEIYKMNSTDGNGLTRLTNHTASDMQPAWSPDGTRIAFQSTRDAGNPEIYVMNSDGTNPVRFTNDSGIDGFPFWSLDSSKIVFASDRDGNGEIYVMNAADGSAPTNLTNNTASDSQPVWLPTGGKIEFTSGRDGDPEVFIMDANGANPVQLTANTTGDWSRAKFISPTVATLAAENVTATGARLKGDMTALGSVSGTTTPAFVSFEWGTTPSYGNTTSPEQAMTAPGIFTFDLNGLTTGVPIHYRAKARGDASPAYGNDMTFTPAAVGLPDLVIAPEDVTIDWVTQATGDYRVSFTIRNNGTAASPSYFYNIAVDGTDVETLTRPGLAVGASWSGIFEYQLDGASDTITVEADWGNAITESNEQNNSVTKTWPPAAPIHPIVFVSERDGNLEVYKMNPDGSGQTNITSNPAWDNMAMLSPDGTKVAFVSERQGNRDVYVMNIDGSGVTRLTSDAAFDVWPTWSPDGTRIVFQTNRDGNLEIYSMNSTDGNGIVRLTNNSVADACPFWSPDGTKIAFQSIRDGNAEIYSMDTNGTNQTRLTDNSALDSLPVWSPDSTKIAFSTDRDGNNEIYVMNADGSSPVNITNNINNDGQPVWLPAGGKIEFTSDRDGDPEVFIMDGNGANQAQLTTNTTGDWSRAKHLSPVVNTLAPENVTATGARLKGDLTALGSVSGTTTPAFVSFEWGTTPSYGNTTSPEQAMTAPGIFTFDLNGLTTGVPIHYRAKARGDASPAYGADMTFTPVAAGTPDLIIVAKSETWIDEVAKKYEVFFTIQNIGTADAPSGHIVGLRVDGTEVGQYTIPVSLPPNDPPWGAVFAFQPILSGETDTIIVTADSTDVVDELNEQNNSVTNTWPLVASKEWTFLVYMAADNDLNDAALVDLNEMEVAGSSDQVNVVTLTDLYGADNTKVYYVQKEATPTDTIVSTIVTPTPFPAEVNMGDPATLTTFVNWAKTQYPATKYVLVLWNHGSGWKTLALNQPKYRYIALDQTGTVDYLTTLEVGAAMGSVRTSLGTAPLLLGYDACLMQMAELAAQVGGSADVMTGSEEVEDANGWPYDLILNALVANPTWGLNEMGAAIQNNYMTFYSTAPNVFSLANMSNVDQSKIPGLLPVINAFADALVASGERVNIANARGQTEQFNDVDYIDLYDFATKAKALVTNPTVQATAEAVRLVLLPVTGSGVIISQAPGTAHPNSRGISIYFPSAAPVDPAYASLAFATGRWDEFLTWLLTPPVPPTWTQIITDPPGDLQGPGPDILGVDKGIPTAGQAAFQVRTAGAMDYLTSWGNTHLDTDQNKATGNPGTGADYAIYVTAYSGGTGAGMSPVRVPANLRVGEPFALLLKWNSTTSLFDTLGQLPIYTGTNSYWSIVLLSQLGNDDGNMDVQQVVGMFDTTGNRIVSDTAPDIVQPPNWFTIISDPFNDANPAGSFDISQVEAYRQPDKVGFTVFFTGTGTPFGATYLDTDQNPATGEAVNDIGADYKVEINFTSGFEARLFKWLAGGSWSDMGILTGGNHPGIALWFDLPLSQVFDDEGNMDVVQKIGTSSAVITDIAPNTGHGSIKEPPWFVLTSDPAGDSNPAGPDITGVDYSYNQDRSVIFFHVRGNSMDSNLYGRTWLDTDQNAATGRVGSTSNDIGADFRADVFNGSPLHGILKRWNPTLSIWIDVGYFPVFKSGSYWFGLKLSDLNNDDGYMNVVQSLGTKIPDGITDTAPDTGHGTIAPRTKDQAITDGITWLVSQQRPDGGWGNDFTLAKTALAVLKLATFAKELNPPKAPLDQSYVYSTNIQNGLNYIFSTAIIVDIGPQPAGNPDTNGNGKGIYFNEGDPERPVEGHPTYNTGIVLMALSAVAAPTAVVNVTGSPVNTRTHASVAQDTIDYFAWGQTDYLPGRGGWDYNGNATVNDGGRSDQSNSGWVTLGLAYAEAPAPHGLGLIVPGFVRTETDRWINYIQNAPGPTGDLNDGGSGYDSPQVWVNMLKTGNILQQMAFNGDVAGTTPTPRVQAAIAYLVRHWNDTTPDSNGIQQWKGHPHAMYTVMKGLEALGVPTIGTPSFDWFAAFVTELLATQHADASWGPAPFDSGDGILATEWALLTLERALPPTREGPDLTVIEKYETWVDEVAKTSYNVHFTIKNKGNVAAPAGYQITATPDGGAPVLGPIGPALNPGQTYTGIIGPLPFTLPEDAVVVMVDAGQTVTELNEQNNSMHNMWPKKPDLTVTEKHEAWVPESTTQYNVFFTIQNTGNVEIPPGHVVGLFVDGALIEQKPVLLPLAPQESFTDLFITTVTLSGATDTIVVRADATNIIPEVIETNNEMVNTWPTVQKPDLIIFEKHEEWLQGSTTQYRVFFTVKNIGVAPFQASSSMTALFIDGVRTFGDTITPTLNPGDTYASSFNTDITLSGAQDNVVVVADPDNQVDESNETNNGLPNVWPTTTQNPDLVVVEKHEQWIDEISRTYKVYFGIQNQGEVPASPGYSVALYVDGSLVTTKLITVSLAPGESFFDVFAPTLAVNGGQDTIMVRVDSSNMIPESDETNNDLTNLWPAIVEKPDLIISEKHETPEPGAAAGTYRVLFTVKNIGNAPSPSGSTIALFVDGVPLATKMLLVAPGPDNVWSSSFDTLPVLSDGSDTVMVVADSTYLLEEMDESNNVLINIWSPQVQKADLIVLEKHESWVQGSSTDYTVAFTIKNIGGAPVPAGAFVGLYIDNAPEMAQQKAISVLLNPGDTWVNSFPTPVTLSSTFDNVKVLVDATGVVDELNETNNEMVNIWPPAVLKPDLRIMEKHEGWIQGSATHYNVFFTLHNAGTAPAPASTYNIVLKRDGASLEVFTTPPALNPGEFWAGNFATNIPLTGGYDEIEVIADFTNTVEELDETNNAMTNFWPRAPKPDLVITEKHEIWLTGSTTQYTVSYTLSNVGDGEAPAGHQTALLIDGVPLSTETLGGLSPGRSLNSELNTVVTISGQSDNITLIADFNQVVDEINENNNTISNVWQGAVQIVPDLIVFQKYEQWVNQVDKTYKVYFTIKNIGMADTPAGHQVGVTIDSVEQTEKITINSILAPNATYSGNFDTVFTMSGTADTILVKADVNEAFPELNELNNTMTNIFVGEIVAPIVLTNEATAVTNTTATLNGDLTGLGSAASVAVNFEWGETTYTNTTAVQTKTATGTFSADLTGLTPGRTYKFRAKASGDGAVTGTEKTFITLSAAVDLKLLPATNNVDIGQTFDITVQAEAGTNQVGGVSAFVNFDQTKLAVVDANAAVEGIQVTPGSSLTVVLDNLADNNSGMVNYSAGKFGTGLTGTFAVATIRFQALAQTSPNTALTFNITGGRITTVDFAGNTITGTLTGATVTVASGASVDISVVLQGGSRPNPAGWAVPLAVKFFNPGANVGVDAPVYSFNLTTAVVGTAPNLTAVAQAAGVNPGNYDILVVSPHTLSNVKRNVAIVAPSTAVDMSILLEGNANDNTNININDFGILAVAYGKTVEMVGYDARANFDCDNNIDISDFGLLAVNFNKSCPLDLP